MKLCTKELLVLMKKYNVDEEEIGKWQADFVKQAKSPNGISAAGLNPWEEYAFLDLRAAKLQDFVTDPSNGEVEVEAMNPLCFNRFQNKKYSTLSRGAMRAVNDAQKAKNALTKAHNIEQKDESTPRPFPRCAPSPSPLLSASLTRYLTRAESATPMQLWRCVSSSSHRNSLRQSLLFLHRSCVSSTHG
jgi:hypothetical protein